MDYYTANNSGRSIRRKAWKGSGWIQTTMGLRLTHDDLVADDWETNPPFKKEVEVYKNHLEIVLKNNQGLRAEFPSTPILGMDYFDVREVNINQWRFYPSDTNPQIDFLYAENNRLKAVIDELLKGRK